MEITRVTWTEATGDGVTKTSFRVDGRVLHSTNSENPVGVVKTFNIPFNYPVTARPNMMRIMVALASSKEGRSVPQAEINKAKFLELTGEKQPLVGAIVAIDATEDKKPTRVSPKNPEGVFTKYEASVPDDRDLAALEKALAAA